MSSRPIALALLILAPAAAHAHEVLHTIERGRAIAVRAYFADGGDLAYREYQVFAPAAPAVPHQEGWTDRKGWLAFVPDSPGTWRVKVSDGSGHGVELAVDAAGSPEARDGGALPTVAFVLRPVAGILAIGAVFAALFALYRRKAPR
jgi:nickel transport protein